VTRNAIGERGQDSRRLKNTPKKDFDRPTKPGTDATQVGKDKEGRQTKGDTAKMLVERHKNCQEKKKADREAKRPTEA